MPNYNQSHSSLSLIDNYLTVVQYVQDQPFWPSIILKIRYPQVFSLQAILSWQKISRWTCLLWSNSSSDPVSSSSSSSSHTVTTNRAESEAGIFHSFFSHPEPTIISTMVGVNKSDDPTLCNRYPYTPLAVQIALMQSVISLRKITYHTAKIFHDFPCFYFMSFSWFYSLIR